MATESWVLDGVALTGSNFGILELNVDPPKARPDWVSAADSEGAALTRQPLYENRTISMELRVASQASMNAALGQVAVIRDKLAKASSTANGIALVWTPANASLSCTFDVLHGEIVGLPIGLEGPGWSWWLQRPIFTIEMTCKPYWRGTETSVSAVTNGTTPFISITIPSVPGDAPALGRLIVTDTGSTARRYVEWGLEQQDYSATPPVLLDSDSMVVSGFTGGLNTTTGAYDPNATGVNVIRAAVFGSPFAICGTGTQSHIGTFRVKARVLSYNQPAFFRFVWQVGDGPLVNNDWVSPSISSPIFTEVDLGLIQIPRVLAGAQEWSGRVEAYCTAAAGASIDIDYLLFMPVAEGYGKARAPYQLKSGTAAAYDLFEGITPATNLNTRALPLGGTWSTSGATADFQAVAGGVESRATASDAGPRFAVVGATNYTDMEAQIGFLVADGVQSQAIARWTDVNNYAFLKIATTDNTLSLGVIVAGVTTLLYLQPENVSSTQWYNLRLAAYASGRLVGMLMESSGAIRRLIDVSHTAIATAGTLASGKPGFSDMKVTAGAVARYYDNFYVNTPAPEPIAIFSGRTLEFRHDDTIRQNSGGTAYGRPPAYRGTRFLVPPAGTDSKTSRVVVKAHANDIEVSDAATVTTATSAQVFYTPRGLVVPR